MTDILDIKKLTIRFGGLVAVDTLSFVVQQGLIHGLIGPNGAGKTTTFNMISGFYTPTSGDIVFQGQHISGLAMHEVARTGLVRTFQHSTLFAELSVIENVLIGTHISYQPSLLSAILGTDNPQKEQARVQALDALRFFDLEHVQDTRAGDLSFGHQRTLGMAVAYASHPKMILLDEPFTGMHPEETRHMMDLMRHLCRSGITILIVEHDMQAIMGLCDKITCMSFGRLLAEGTAEEIRSNPDVIEAYLGDAHVA